MVITAIARFVLQFGLLAALAACGNPPGTPCQIKGSGFTASHDCATKCLSRWSMQCPDATQVMPAVCAGRAGCTPGSCPDGQACYAFDDPFEDRSYCVPADVCGTVTGAAERLQWEQTSAARAAETRARYKQRQQRRSGLTTKPVAPEIPQPTAK